MGIIGHNWNDEESAAEKFADITGVQPELDKDEDVLKEIDRKLDNPEWTSRSERNRLLDLRSQILRWNNND